MVKLIDKRKPFSANGSEKLLDLKKIQAIVWKNWLVIKSDRMRLIPMLIFPIIMITVFGFASTGTPRDLPAALVDYDHSTASGALIQALHGVNVISIRYEVGTESEAQKLMDGGLIKAVMIIPQGFGKALDTGGSQAQLVVKVDESDSTVAQIIKSLLQQTVSQYSRQQAMIKLAALQAKQNAVVQSLKQNAGTLDAISKIMSDGSTLETEGKTLRYISTILQRDFQQADSQERDLKNKVGYSESKDVSYTGGVAGSSYDQYLPQIQALEAQKASDLQALAGVALVLASNAKQSAGDASYATALASASGALESSAGALDGGAVDVQVLLTPVVYTDEPAYGEGRKNIDFLLPAIIAMVIFQGATMGMGRALAGEKKDGSLTRVFLTPTSNATILTGTMLFYMIFESIRSSFLVFAAMILFGVTLKGSLIVTLFIIMLFALGSTALGLLLSAMTASQEQYMAVSMLVSLPAMFLSGVFFPVQTMPQLLQNIAGILPISYAATALRGVMIKGFDLGTVMPQVVILMGFAIAFTVLALAVFKREIA